MFAFFPVVPEQNPYPLSLVTAQEIYRPLLSPLDNLLFWSGAPWKGSLIQELGDQSIKISQPWCPSYHLHVLLKECFC